MREKIEKPEKLSKTDGVQMQKLLGWVCQMVANQKRG